MIAYRYDAATDSVAVRPCQSPVKAGDGSWSEVYCKQPAEHLVQVEFGALELCDYCTGDAIDAGWGEPIGPLA